jgi:HlyD family secretion protein
VEGGIVIWESQDVLKIPSSALFRTADAWTVFGVEGGKAFRRHVVVGRRTRFDVEIISGLDEGAQIIVHPSNEVTEARAVITQSN